MSKGPGGGGGGGRGKGRPIVMDQRSNIVHVVMEKQQKQEGRLGSGFASLEALTQSVSHCFCVSISVCVREGDKYGFF